MSGVRVLVVEDERSIADLIRTYLENEGYECRIVDDGARALEEMRSYRPAAAFVDIGLPGLPGTDLVRRLRAEGDRTPVVFVTARDDEFDRVLGLELGADDYVTKPFSARELMARLRAVLRRTHAPRPDGDPPVVHGDLEVDAAARRVRVAGREVELTTTEFDLLHYLVRRPGRVCSRELLLQEVWGYPPDIVTRTVDVHVAQLRAKLGDAVTVRGVRGVGYAFDPAEP